MGTVQEDKMSTYNLVRLFLFYFIFYFTFLLFVPTLEKPEKQLAGGKSGRTKTKKKLLSILLGGKGNLNSINMQV